MPTAVLCLCLGAALSRHRRPPFALSRLLAFICVVLVACLVSGSPSLRPTIASKYATPVEALSAADRTLLASLSSFVPPSVAHTGATGFDEHLHGVYLLLKGSGAPESTQKAGLYHSVYGTEGFQGYSISLSRRGEVRRAIGEQAEALAFTFCVVDRAAVDEQVGLLHDALAASGRLPGPPPDGVRLRSRPELGNFDIVLTAPEFLAFLELSLADWLEQVEGASERANPLFHWGAGEAWAYRRTAYRAMADILAAADPGRLGGAKAVYAEVFSAEGRETQTLVQARTPPMSGAARDARVAMRAAAGEGGGEEEGGYGPKRDLEAFARSRIRGAANHRAMPDL
jgi:hypothetical protein